MSYSKISSHRSMVFDEYRNNIYMQAIRHVVTSESVVLDLGAGVGIHGLIAAAAGAKRVYLVDPEPVVRLAIELAKENGLVDRIVVLEGRIEDVQLPEPVDLITSVFTGNLLFSEDLLPSLFHARDRYLKPGGYLIPDLAELMLAPVSAQTIHAKYIQRWSEPTLDLNFEPIRRFAANEILRVSRDELDFERLAVSTCIATVDLRHATRADCLGHTTTHISLSGTCHGLLGSIRIRIGDQWLSSDPADPKVHWSPVILPLDPPLNCALGDEISISLRRPVYGDWSWSATVNLESRRHSSFLARIDGIDRLKKITPNYCSGITHTGEIALQILQRMQQGENNQSISKEIFQAATNKLFDFEEALLLVQDMALRYRK